MTKKKILYINMNQYGYSAGHKYYCDYLSETYEVFYISFDQGHKRFNTDNTGIKNIYVSWNHRERLKSLWYFMITTVRNHKIIKPHFTVSVLTGKAVHTLIFILITFLLLKSKSKRILDIRTVSVNRKSIIRKLENRLLYITSKLYDSIIVFNEYIRDFLILNQQKTIIVPLGAIKISETIKKYDHFAMIYLGILENRNIHIAIEAFSLFIHESNRKDQVFYIIGFGNKEIELLKQKIVELKLEDRIFLLGRKDHSEARKYFDICNIGLSYVPINKYYNIQPPTKIYEYLLSGLITIATDTYASRLIINKSNGILCNDNIYELKNALVKIENEMHNFNYSEIVNSVRNNDFRNIVHKYLIPKVFN